MAAGLAERVGGSVLKRLFGWQPVDRDLDRVVKGSQPMREGERTEEPMYQSSQVSRT
jgi:hypothetical protein